MQLLMIESVGKVASRPESSTGPIAVVPLARPPTGGSRRAVDAVERLAREKYIECIVSARRRAVPAQVTPRSPIATGENVNMSDAPFLPLVQIVIEAGATLAFGLSGIFAAARKRLDAVGVCVVAGLAAFGGGTLRDVLLDRRPFVWVAHTGWLWALLAICAGSMAFLRSRHFEPTEKAMQWPDAIGLGLFSASGTQLAIAQNLPGLVAVLMGVITATFGGVLRDIVCNEIPAALRDHRPYAVCAFIGGWALVMADHQHLPQGIGLLLGAACASGLRMLALMTRFTLPKWSPGGDGKS